ncbi:hypothetical protein NDU88_001833 [Pleurodeles waltl]|uniref:Myb/SANT-like DNA-binding domain-containing protein n=1 Tax=Pleurodeles waltl TaxID=8319 RepID=A0AAV7RBH0_PLEWA|nr:hypothetical protein NDU88_001833 [Pleurodeles waltl]
MIRTAADVTAADVIAIFYLFNHSIPDLRQEKTYTASAAVTSVWKRQWHVSAHQKKDFWRAIAKDVRTLGVHQRQSTHCRKRWEDIRRWSKKAAEAQLGMASECGRVARRTMTPLMFRILAVAESDVRMRASQQTQGGEYTHILMTLRAVEGSGWGRRAVGFPRPGRVP